MENLEEFLKKYQNIAEIFSAKWFESELMNPKEQMHLLAKQFTFGDTPYDNTISYHLFNHLEEYLGDLREEIHQKGRISKKLKKIQEFRSAFAQIEIAFFFKKLGFQIELEPQIPESAKISDIKISKGDKSVYIEVRVLKERNGELIDKLGSVEIYKINRHPITTVKGKIKQESVQLANGYPGIIAFHLDPSIPISMHIRYACLLAIQEYPTLSGILLYHHFFNSDGCNIIIDLIKNPDTNNPLPNSFLIDLNKGGVEISELPVYET